MRSFFNCLPTYTDAFSPNDMIERLTINLAFVCKHLPTFISKPLGRLALRAVRWMTIDSDIRAIFSTIADLAFAWNVLLLSINSART